MVAKLITVVNQKGGVGKTTVACHLGFAAQKAGKRVLVVDLDTQGNASQFLTKDLGISKRRGGAEQLFQGLDFDEIKYSETAREGLQVLHGHGFLEELDNQRDGVLRIAVGLRQKVRALPFDYVIFDTPPSIGPRHVAPLFWSDSAIVTIQPNLASVTGLDAIFDTIRDVLKVNPGLATKLVINLFTRSSSTQRKTCSRLHEMFGTQILGEFSMRVAVSDALADYKPVWEHAKDKKLNTAWLDFANKALGL